MKKRILIITTGGTIAMRYDSEKGVIPSDELIEFLLKFPKLNSVANIDILEFANIPSPFMTPDKMFELSKFVDLKIIDYDGIVITHGTDTLEETAYMLDLTLTTRKPVVFTAAMRSGDELGLDGPRNIVGSVRVAAHPNSIDKGVLVVMNDEIHTARDVVKVDTGRVDSFESPGYGTLGYIDSDDIIYHRKIIQRDSVWTDKIETNVDLIKMVSGISNRYLKSSLDNNAKGIIIEAFGRGNIPPYLVTDIVNLVNNNIIVVLVSRAYTGRVLPEYGYSGGGKDLVNHGVIMGGDLKGPKARIKLMCLLGKYIEPETVKKMFL
ncbi:MAG: asparaginase [Candidatus Cloacimonadales bacterium]|nr:asparaginase [Candidatus Cloacimonadota bacterium]MDD2649512.1 asparaginase [Candidatus Cloacimonadota bacterium]MDD3501449.1 asparaginase [Candidatus Cloacimonadota bacterium]MDX9977556.1 asparaginase [Candidatus Cloacimonadales bacterium]